MEKKKKVEERQHGKSGQAHCVKKQKTGGKGKKIKERKVLLKSEGERKRKKKCLRSLCACKTMTLKAMIVVTRFPDPQRPPFVL